MAKRSRLFVQASRKGSLITTAVKYGRVGAPVTLHSVTGTYPLTAASMTAITEAITTRKRPGTEGVNA